MKDENRGGHFSFRDIVSFIREHDRRGYCFSRWPTNILEPHLRFSDKNGDLYIVSDGDELVGVGIARQVNEDELDKHWIRSRETSDSVEVTDLLCSTKRAVGAIAAAFAERIPGWQERKLFMCRHGVRRRIPDGGIERLIEWKQ
jgi:hypothetical protein